MRDYADVKKEYKDILMSEIDYTRAISDEEILDLIDEKISSA